MSKLFKIALVFVLGLVFGLGAASVANAAEACVPQDATETTYKEIPNPDYVPAVPEIPEISHVESVVVTPGYTEPDTVITNDDAVPAWTEVIPAVYKTVHHEAEYENVHHDAVKHLEYKFRNIFTNDILWVADPNWYGFGWLNSGHTRWVVDHEAWNEQVLVKEAWDEQVLVTAEQIVEHPAVPATTTVVPGKVVPPVTEERKVIDQEFVPGTPAEGTPTISVVDVEGQPAVVCEPEEEPTEEPTPTETPSQEPSVEPSPTQTVVPVSAPVVSEVSTVATPKKAEVTHLAATGVSEALPTLAGVGLSIILLGVVALMATRRKKVWDGR